MIHRFLITLKIGCVVIWSFISFGLFMPMSCGFVPGSDIHGNPDNLFLYIGSFVFILFPFLISPVYYVFTGRNFLKWMFKEMMDDIEKTNERNRR